MASEQELVELQEALYTSKNPTRRWLHCTRRDWIIDAVTRYTATDSTGARAALEIGPGSGIYLPVLMDLYDEVYCSDIEDAYLNHARTHLCEGRNLSVVVDDITRSRLPEGYFDLILCTEVIEHMTESGKAIAHMHRLLKPGGILVLSTPQRYSPLEICAKVAFVPGIIQMVRLIYREPILETGHINLMTERAVTDQVIDAGFSIVDRYKTGVYIPVLAELTGRFGLAIERYLEKRLRNGRADWLLWTQYYIARA